MKKIILFFCILVSFLGYSQQELKIDIADALIIKSIDVSYENYLTESSSFGISVLVNLEKQSSDFRYNENMMITPYYRHYFTTNAQWNFFGEGFVGINAGKVKSEGSSNYDLKYTDSAIGVAVGTKYATKSGLTIDVYGGLGRNLFSTDSPIIVPRVGVNVGWRF